MWRLITDHIWRWRVALVCCGLLESAFQLGIWAAGQKPRFFLLTPYFGALLMAIDWKRSAGRTLRLLPLPLGQLAAGLWAQGVVVAPLIVLGVDLAVAVAKWGLAPELAPAASTLGMFFLFHLAGSGAMFLALTMIHPSEKIRQGSQFSQILAGGLWGLGMGSGGLLVSTAPATFGDAGLKSLALTLAGLAMGAAGWWRLRHPPAPSQAAADPSAGRKARRGTKPEAGALSGRSGYGGLLIRNIWQTAVAVAVMPLAGAFVGGTFLTLSGGQSGWNLETGLTIWRTMSVQVVLLSTLAGFRWWAPHLRQWKTLPLGDGELAWRLLLLPLSSLATGAATTLCLLRLAGGGWPPAHVVMLMAVVGLFTLALMAIGLNWSQKLAMILGLSLLPLQGLLGLAVEKSTRHAGLLDIALVASAVLLATAYAATRAALRSPVAMGRPRPAAMAASPG